MRKKVLIVYASPEPTSNRQLVEVAVQTLQQQGHEVLLSDLYGMHALFPGHGRAAHVCGLRRCASNREGQRLRDALDAAGLTGVPRVRLEKGRHMGYLEPHIEQGGRLEATGKSIGVVTTIVGIRELRVRFTGQRNHAGTTPMSIRRDAGAALVDFIARLNEAFRHLADSDTVWTVGRIDLEPGSLSVVPGQADMYLQFRDANAARLRAMDAKLAELVREFNAQGPVGVPSIGGVSHDFIEDTAEEHIVLGCQVAVTAAVAILQALRAKQS